MRSLICSFMLFSTLAARHGAIIAATGDQGGSGMAIGIDTSTPRDGTDNVPFQQDTTVFDGDAQFACGETDQTADNDSIKGIESGVGTVIANSNSSQLPQVSQDSVLRIALHQVNSDGGEPYVCMIDATGRGQNWVAMQVTEKVPGDDGDNDDGEATDFPLTARVAQDQICTGNIAGQANMFGDVVGDHPTMSGATMWVVKYLSDLSHIQTKLRSVLQQPLCDAHKEGRLLTFEELRHAKVTYLGAIIEEMLRINAVPVTREAMCDTTILGWPIKRGTQVFFMSGPGFLCPFMAIENERRSESSRSAKANASWDESRYLSASEPERWLVRKDTSKAENSVLASDVDFDGAAGPQLAFGLGPRSCWSRRLGYMEICTMVSMLPWTYELLEAPKDLSGYSGFDGIARVPKKCYLRLRPLLALI